MEPENFNAHHLDPPRHESQQDVGSLSLGLLLNVNSEPGGKPETLSRQVENMATDVTSGKPSFGLSEQLLAFAEDVRELEQKIGKLQATTTNQQMYIKHLEEKVDPQHTSKSREETEHLNGEPCRVLSNKNSAAAQENAMSDWTFIPDAKETLAGSHIEYSLMQQSTTSTLEQMSMLQQTNAKLFQANQDWQEKWEMLNEIKQSEHDRLVSNLLEVDATRENLQLQFHSLQKLLEKEKSERTEVESSLAQHKELITSLESELMQRDLAITSLKGEKNSRDRRTQPHDAEIDLLKQQMTVFMQDFEREKKEKTVYREKLRKKEADYEKLKTSHEDKVRSLNMEVKRKDNRLREKTAEMDRLQHRVIQLTEDVKEERKKSRPGTAVTNQQHIHSVEATSEREPSSVLYPSGTGLPISALSYSNFAVGGRKSPAELAGAWTCNDCTFRNYPDRTVCDMCGLTRDLNQDEPGFGELLSRNYSPVSVKPVNYGRNVPD